ncbi:unnamed protein product [Caenorhabditis nigoni]
MSSQKSLKERLEEKAMMELKAELATGLAPDTYVIDELVELKNNDLTIRARCPPLEESLEMFWFNHMGNAVSLVSYTMNIRDPKACPQMDTSLRFHNLPEAAGEMVEFKGTAVHSDSTSPHLFFKATVPREGRKNLMIASGTSWLKMDEPQLAYFHLPRDNQPPANPSSQ